MKAMLEERHTSEEVKNDTLEWYKDNIITHAEDLIKYRLELLALAEAQKAEAKRMVESSKAKELKAERIMQELDEAMTIIGEKELQAGNFKLKYKKGSVVTKVNEDLLPSKYWTSKVIETPMNKSDLKYLVENGEAIAGVEVIRNPDKLEVKI